MNGDKALEPAKTIRKPINIKTTMTGINQNFLLSKRNSKSSFIMMFFLGS